MKNKIRLLFCGILFSVAVLLLIGCNVQQDDPSSNAVSSGNSPEMEEPLYSLQYVCEPEDAGIFKGKTEYKLEKGQKGGYIQVLPTDGYDFVGWSDGVQETKRGADKLKKNKDQVIIAKFQKRPYKLSYVADSPIGGTIYGETEQNLREGEISTTVTAVPAAYYSFQGWSDGVKDYSRTGDSVNGDTVIIAIFKHDPIEVVVPTLSIVTSDYQTIKSKTEYKSATISISGAAKEEYNLENLSARLKGRGNSSWSNSAISTPSSHKSKNSYTMKLENKEQLLGLGNGKAKTWILNSCKFDESGLRNWICWRLASLSDGVPYSIDSAWVHLYMNGEYRGIYLLTEKVEASSSRINIEADDSSVLDKGYLIQLDKRAEGIENWDYFYIDDYYGEDKEKKQLRPFVIENGVESEEQVKYIKDYMQRCSNAIFGGDEEKIKELVDVDSFMEMLLIEELSKDVDVNFASFYMYKAPGGKLTLTSPWDFDFGFGTYSSAQSLSDLICEKTIGNAWFKALLKQEWFCKQLREHMEKFVPLLRQIQDEMWAMEESLTVAYDRNNEKWNIYGNSYAEYVAGQVSRDLTSYHAHIEYLSNWIDERWALMEKYFEDYANGKGSLQS